PRPGSGRSPAERNETMTNESLERWVRDEVYWDPQLDSSELALSADDGRITLRGTVGSLREKRAAGEAALRVRGLTSPDNELDVRPLAGFARKDAEVRGNVLQALMLKSAVPGGIDAQVSDGKVTLTGEADWQYQRRQAEICAGNVPGVVDVDDRIRLAHQATA